MRGQWIGPYKGTNEGIAIVELDDMGDHFEGSAYAYSANPALPHLWAPVRTKDKELKFVLNLRVKPIDMALGMIVEWDQVKDRYPGITLSPDLETNWEFTANEVHLAWKTPIDTNGQAHLSKSRAMDPSQYKPDESIKSWAAFKEFTVSLEPQRFVFRG